ncbi:MAG: CPBP family intramembrane metalloprotease [Deltaproteobacteria bacterium]|nr:MAG: CPBP family intramembrane metalloprotease [Deltaproteobacteria bacterium]
MEQIKSYVRDIEKKSAVVTLSAVLLMTVWLYQGHPSFFKEHLARYLGSNPYIDWYQYLYMHIVSFLLWFVIPLLLIKLLLKENLAGWGLCLGDYRFGLKFLFLAMVIMVLPLYLNAQSPEFQAEYPLTKLAGKSPTHFLLWELTYLIYYISFEFIFRGYMLFGLKDKLGPFMAIMAQTIPSTIIHIGKPEGETIAAILSGIVLGAVALRTRSILYVLIFHWYVGITTDYFCLINSGTG